jgi:hypothetical protein
MTFNFELCGNVANISTFPRYVGIDTSGNAQPIGFDLNGNGNDEIFVNVKDSLFGFRDNGNSIRVDMPGGYLFDSSAGFIPGFTGSTINGNTNYIACVKNNLFTLLHFDIDTATAAPFFLRYENLSGNFSTPVLRLNNPGSETMHIGTGTGRIVNITIPALNVTTDTVSALPVREMASRLENTNTTPGYIDNSYKFFALGNLVVKVVNDFVPDTVLVTNDNKILLNRQLVSGNLGITVIHSSPVLADLNKDGSQDIIFTADNKVFAVNRFGVLLDNFPFSAPNVNRISSGCSVADLNSDGINDVLFGTVDGRVYAYGADGRVLEGFPLVTGGEIRSTPAIINSGGFFGVLVYSMDGYLYGYKTPWAYDSSKVIWANYLRDKYHSNSNYSSSSQSISGPCLPSDKVYNWPNPAYGKYTSIRYFLNGDVTGISIKIMDLSGELVTTLAGTTNKGFDNEVPWDISNVQSGIYIAVLELSGGCSETASIKIAVVK